VLASGIDIKVNVLVLNLLQFFLLLLGGVLWLVVQCGHVWNNVQRDILKVNGKE